MSGKATMRAVTVPTWGAPEVLTMAEVARPVPIAGEVLVRVRAAAVNPTDWKSRASGAGYWEDPVILGYDVSGVVEEVGPGVTLHRPGDEVFGMPRFPRQAGAYAEYVTAPARHFVRKPAAVDHVQAAALPLVSLTAWQALTDFAELRPGQRVLVHAAAGGLGHLAVQVAKSLGAEVVGTARAAKHEFLRSLGVDEAIDYTTQDFATATRPVDVVLDTVGADYGARSMDLLRDGGTLVSLTSWEGVPAPVRGIRTGFLLVEPDHHGLTTIAGLVDQGALRAEIAAALPLHRAAEAHRLGETGRTTGKIVLTVD